MSNHSLKDVKLLLLRVAEGDEAAFALLFRAYYNQLGDFILRITESAPLTQEIVQDVFLKIWTNRQALKEVECFRAYLIVVARNHAFNCLKQLARERTRRKAWADSVLQQASLPTIDAELPDTSRLIEEAVQLLPPRQKNVYILSRQEGYSQENIAQKLNISHETVKKHMVLALRFLRNHLRAHISRILFGLLLFFLG